MCHLPKPLGWQESLLQTVSRPSRGGLEAPLSTAASCCFLASVSAPQAAVQTPLRPRTMGLLLSKTWEAGGVSCEPHCRTTRSFPAYLLPVRLGTWLSAWQGQDRLISSAHRPKYVPSHAARQQSSAGYWAPPAPTCTLRKPRAIPSIAPGLLCCSGSVGDKQEACLKPEGAPHQHKASNKGCLAAQWRAGELGDKYSGDRRPLCRMAGGEAEAVMGCGSFRRGHCPSRDHCGYAGVGRGRMQVQQGRGRRGQGLSAALFSYRCEWTEVKDQKTGSSEL